MDRGVLVFVEQREGEIKKSSLEAVSEGRRLADQAGGQLSALVAGSGIESLAAKLTALGSDRVILANHESLTDYSPEGFAGVLSAVAKESQPSFVLMAASAMGADLAPRTAAILEAGLVTDCIAWSLDGSTFQVTKPVYAGKAMATFEFQNSPVRIMTLRPNVFEASEEDSSRSGSVDETSVGELNIRAKIRETERSASGTVELTEADVIVSGGRGVKDPENFSIIKELADELGGAMGASRAAVDAGWIDHQFQVGQTGKTVSPNLYVACGISGAIQHLAGMSSSRVIVAINKDPEAPIFKVANYGIVGDLFEIVPLLTSEVRKLKAS